MVTSRDVPGWARALPLPIPAGSPVSPRPLLSLGTLPALQQGLRASLAFASLVADPHVCGAEVASRAERPVLLSQGFSVPRAAWGKLCACPLQDTFQTVPLVCCFSDLTSWPRPPWEKLFPPSLLQKPLAAAWAGLWGSGVSAKPH